MGKDVSLFVGQKCEMTFLKKLNMYPPCIVSKNFSLFGYILPILITFSNSFIDFYTLYYVLVFLSGVQR